MIFLQNYERRHLHGCYVAVEWGKHLTSGPSSKLMYQVRVETLHQFSPLDERIVNAVLHRKRRAAGGERMKFYERKVTLEQCKSLWKLYLFYHDKLNL